MSVNFCPVTRDTNSGPISDIHVNFWPKKAMQIEFLRGLITLVCQTVQNVEYSSAKSNQNQRSCDVGGGIDQNDLVEFW